MSNATADSVYTIQDIPGKGKGLVATRKITVGTRILAEEPIIIIPQFGPDSQTLLLLVRKQVDVLTPDQQKAFHSLHNIYAEDALPKYLGILKTNSLPFSAKQGGVFLEACRINHACDNNAHTAWNKIIKRHTVHAKREIQKGEEITINYLGVTASRAVRQEALQRKFAFTCSCHLCSLPPAQSQESDRRLDETLKLENLIGRDGPMAISLAPLRMVRCLDQQVRLFNEHGPNDNGLPWALLSAANTAIAHGDEARGRIFAERAETAWRILEGDDSLTVFQTRNMSQAPSRDELYGFSMKWKTTLDDIPRTLDTKEFEDWLWKRDKPNQPGQPADFRNRTTFPSFIELPDKIDLSPEFYERFDELDIQPRRHWLFLAEIINITPFINLQVTVKDVEGAVVPIVFYTDDRGGEIAPTQVQKGYTVAILYGHRYAFVFSQPGIRHDEPPNLKIFPLSLNELLELSDRVQKFSTSTNNTRTCHGCDKKGACLMKCKKCSFFWYCSRACQKIGWNEKAHKVDCKLLRDTDLKGLFSLDWDKFESRMGFPLKSSVV